MDIAAGEYGYTSWYFDHMLSAGAVDVLQADATRCAGISGFLDVGSLCWAKNVPLSSHCGPSMHLHVCCAVPRVIHMEFFHDHVRIERMLFDGFCEPSSRCDVSRLVATWVWTGTESGRCQEIRSMKVRTKQVRSVYGETSFGFAC